MGQNVFAHERLAIVDVESGAQPLVNKERTHVLVVNGEIYNHKDLEKQLKHKHEFLTHSDCEVLLYLYEEEGAGFLDRIQGDFAFVVSDGKTYLAARDAIGVCPLYMGTGADGSVWFASEMKALISDCVKIETFPPGHYYTPETGLQPYWKPKWADVIPTLPVDYAKLRDSFEQAVVRRMMCDVPYGVLLSGGLDSSLVASIVVRHSAMRMEESFQSPAWWPRVHSFCIGLTKDSPDQVAARGTESLCRLKYSPALICCATQQRLPNFSELRITSLRLRFRMVSMPSRALFGIWRHMMSPPSVLALRCSS
jgi:asparagine synthase (glutamine-hydrolysing)